MITTGMHFYIYKKLGSKNLHNTLHQAFDLTAEKQMRLYAQLHLDLFYEHYLYKFSIEFFQEPT